MEHGPDLSMPNDELEFLDALLERLSKCEGYLTDVESRALEIVRHVVSDLARFDDCD